MDKTKKAKWLLKMKKTNKKEDLELAERYFEGHKKVPIEDFYKDEDNDWTIFIGDLVKKYDSIYDMTEREVRKYIKIMKLSKESARALALFDEVRPKLK